MVEPTEPAAPANKEPTLAELQAMAEQAVKTAEEAKTVAEARTEVKRSVKEEGEAQGFKITEEQAEMIAGVTIAQLEERGAFSGGPDVPPAGEGAEPAHQVPAAQPPQGAAPAPPGPKPVGEPAQGDVPPPVVPPQEQEPRRPSLAERFQGR